MIEFNVLITNPGLPAKTRVNLINTDISGQARYAPNGFANFYNGPPMPSLVLTDVLIDAPGYAPFSYFAETGLLIQFGDKTLNITCTLTPSFNIPLWRPTEEQLSVYRGAFCVPDVFPGTDPYGDGDRIWTPAFLAYNEFRQDDIIDRYLENYPEFSRFVINLGGSTYHNDYPHIADDPFVARKGIVKLLNAHLIPVCCATDDEHPDEVLNSWIQNADIIDDGFVMWEMNGPCQNDTNRMFEIIKKVCEANLKAKPKIHFTAGHGSIGEPEGWWWQQCAAVGVGGLFSQDEGFNRLGHNEDGDPIGTASGLEDTAAHLHGQVAGWEGLNLINVAFEQTTTPVYHKMYGWNGPKQRAFGDYLLDHCPNIAGVLDGHN